MSATETIVVTDADAAILGMMRLNEPLRRELGRARVVAREAVPADVATMNSLVRYADETNGVVRTVALVYPRAVPGGKAMVSVLTPLGSALLGLSVGQAIEWDFPDGSRRRLRLEAVLYQPERDARRPRGRARAS